LAKSLLLPNVKRRKVECNGFSRSVRNKIAIFISDQDDGGAGGGEAGDGVDSAADDLGQGLVASDEQ
jgi:hypothetical protein